jgi:hypothetical protein
MYDGTIRGTTCCQWLANPHANKHKQHVLELLLGPAEEGRRQQLQDMSGRVVDRERDRVALDELHEEPERKERDQI